MRARKYWIAAALVTMTAQASELRVEHRYLHVPVARGGEPQMVHLLDGKQIVRYFSVALPEDASDRLFWSTTSMGEFRGRSLTVRIVPRAPKEGETTPPPTVTAEQFVALCEQSDAIRRPPNAYHEKYRPQFHFTPMVGWTNDPNGLVYLDGEYHLFFQHNPYGTQWGNMTWGHAISKDLMHWKEIGDALLPDAMGTIYSGSAVVDRKNTAGFRTGPTQPIVAFYTAAGAHAPEKVPFTQAAAYSLDRGRSWTKYEGNPVVDFIEGTNRDPKVFWHQASKQWKMALYLSRGKFVLLGSKNLREWEKLSEVPFPDGHECPELFELRVDGDRKNTRWVMWEGGGRHMIGQFDGQTFTPETGVLPSEWGRNSYAGQTYNDMFDKRRILLTWMRARTGRRADEEIYPGMPFNQQMSFPRELSLRTTPDGIRLIAQPAREIERLYAKRHDQSGVALRAGVNPLGGIEGELFDIAAEVELQTAKTVTLDIRGTPIRYDAAAKTLSCLGKSVTVRPAGDRLDLRVLVDRTSLEIFTDGGRYVMSFCFRPAENNHRLALTADGGEALAKTLAVRELNSVWP